MATIDIDSILSAIEDGVSSLAADELPGYVSGAEKDAGDFLVQIKTDLARWSTELVNGQISRNEFSNLVRGDDNLLEMAALTKAGVKQAKMDAFKAGVVTIVIKVVSALI
jgi:hypothetical protein